MPDSLFLIPTPMPLEHELILAHILDVDRSFFVSHPNPTLTAPQSKRFRAMLAEFEAGTPLPYIIGYKEFFGRRFEVNQHTLIPRPESELFIDVVKRIAHKKTTIIDVGTGSGCIAITLNKELHTTIHATDCSPDALEVARRNANNMQAQVHFHQGNLLEPVKHIMERASHLIICANLPYIPTSEYHALSADVRAEPRSALDGGEDGLKHYRELFAQCASYAHPETHIFCEIMPDQAHAISALAHDAIPITSITIHHDLAHRPRIAHLLTPQNVKAL